MRYEIALARRVPGAQPTGAGFTGWSTRRGLGALGETRLFAASLVSITPGGGAGGHQHGSTGGWLPGGTVVPVTAAVD